MKTAVIAPLALCFAATTSFASLTPRDLPLSVSVGTRLDAQGDSAEVMLTNPTQAPLLCERLDVSLSVIRAENDLPAGTIDLRYQNIFLRAGESLTESAIGANELKRLRYAEPSARLFRIIPSLGACRVAEWSDYCNHAPLSIEERKTVDVLKDAFGARACEELRADDIFKINLAYTGIRDLQPLAYFPNLTSLRLGGNPIASVTPLYKLEHLKRACLGQTPVAARGPLRDPFRTDCR